LFTTVALLPLTWWKNSQKLKQGTTDSSALSVKTPVVNKNQRQTEKQQLIRQMSEPFDPSWRDKILSSSEECLGYLKDLQDIVNDNIDFIDFTQTDTKTSCPLGARFHDEEAAKEYLKVLLKLENLIRPDIKLKLKPSEDPQEFLRLRFQNLTELVEDAFKVLDNQGKITADTKATLNQALDFAGDFEVVRLSGGLNEACLENMLNILQESPETTKSKKIPDNTQFLLIDGDT
jgi:hypothetical protein